VYLLLVFFLYPLEEQREKGKGGERRTYVLLCHLTFGVHSVGVDVPTQVRESAIETAKHVESGYNACCIQGSQRGILLLKAKKVREGGGSRKKEKEATHELQGLAEFNDIRRYVHGIVIFSAAKEINNLDNLLIKRKCPLIVVAFLQVLCIKIVRNDNTNKE